MPLFGYARVSTRDQDLAAQDAELRAAGCAKVFKEKISGAKTDRPELVKAIGRLEPGDVLVVSHRPRRFIGGRPGLRRQGKGGHPIASQS
jgi:DNA invertase Pin-like site-specific DNA recombinase